MYGWAVHWKDHNFSNINSAFGKLRIITIEKTSVNVFQSIKDQWATLPAGCLFIAYVRAANEGYATGYVSADRKYGSVFASDSWGAAYLGCSNGTITQHNIV